MSGGRGQASGQTGAYPNSAGRCQQHQELIRQLTGYATQLLAGNLPDKTDFLRYFDSWLVRHIDGEDREYGGFLNAKGIY